MAGCWGFDYPSTPNGGFWLGTSGTWSIQSTYARNGRKALRVQPSSGAAWVQADLNNTAISDWSTQTHIMFIDLPDADCPILSSYRTAGGVWHCGLAWNNSTGKLRPYVIRTDDVTYYGSDGIAPTTDTFYKIDLRIHGGTLMEWRVDDAAQPDFTNGPDYALGSVIFGAFGATVTADIAYDDHTMLDGSPIPDWLPTLQVVCLLPDSDGTHNTPSYFTDDASNSPPAANLYQRIDEGPSSSQADYFYQNTDDTSAYMEFGHGAIPPEIVPGSAPFVGAIRAGYSQPAAQLGTPITAKMFSGANQWGNDLGLGNVVTGGKFYARTLIENPTGGWDTDKLSAAIWRVGYQDGSWYQSHCHDLHSEWALKEQVISGYWGVLLSPA